ncbi:hypothetical protein AAY473_007879 [Plecturocebus cupreus]
MALVLCSSEFQFKNPVKQNMQPSLTFCSPILPPTEEDPLHPLPPPYNPPADIRSPSVSSSMSPPPVSISIPPQDTPPIASCLLSRQEVVTPLLPLREAPSPIGSDCSSIPLLVLTPLVESTLQTHQPTWNDCQQLLLTLFDISLEEEAQDLLEEVFPSSQPDWDPNTSRGRRALDHFHRYLLAGIKVAAWKPINLFKTIGVFQGPDKSPGAFLERLQEAYQIYTPFDTVAPENSCAINLLFVAQAAPDIRKNLQKLEGFARMNISQLLEIAQMAFNNRDHEKQKQAAPAAEKASKTQAKIIVAALLKQLST